MWSKSKWNSIVDAWLFILMMAMAGLGLLIKYVLCSGSQRWAIYGQNVDLLFCGLDRHQWGSIHLMLALAFSVFLLLHIVLHWKQIKHMYRTLIPQSTVRRVLGCAFLLLSLALLLFPALISVSPIQINEGQGHHSMESQNPAGSAAHRPPLSELPPLPKASYSTAQRHRTPPVRITGQMTLQDIETQYHIPCDSLIVLLGLPQSTAATQRLGRLRKQFGFHMSTVEKVIRQHSTVQR